MDVEGSPLLGAGKKVSPLYMKIPGANCLGTQAVKQRHFSPRRYTHWGERKAEWVRRREHLRMCLFVWWHILQLTICIFQRLLLLGGLGDDLDPLAEEDSYVGAVPVQHLHRQHEVLPFIWIADIQRLSGAEVLRSRKRERLEDLVWTLVYSFTSL